MRTVYRNAELHLGNGESCLGTLITENETIVSVCPGEAEEADLSVSDKILDLSGRLVLPGLVDVHTHGRAGYDFTSASEPQMKEMARSYLRSGVTTLMPTLASAPFTALCDAADRIVSIASETRNGSECLPRFAGVHLEGRYLNPEKRGAHALKQLAPPDAEELKRLLPHLGKRFHISFAPECDRDGSFIETAVRAGGTVGIAHTSADYAEAMTALANGAVSFTHTYNAMPPLHHREGGAVAAALVSDAYAELICDGVHVAPEMVKLAYRAKGSEKLVLITDSMEATGCADGIYSIAGMTCIVKNGKAMTEDGHLAGSTLSLLDGLWNLMRFCGITLDEALPTATRNPARMIGLGESIGTLETGKYADFLILERDSERFVSAAPRIFSVISRGMAV